MSLELLKEDIKKSAFRPAYVLYGEEGYLRGHYRELLIEKTVANQCPEFNLHRFDGAAFSLPDLLAAMEGYPCMGERKTIVVKNLAPAKYGPHLEELGRAMIEMPDTNTVLFEYDETMDPIKKCNDLLEMVKKTKGLLCPCAPPKETELAAWVKRHFAAHKKEISPLDVDYLLSVCDHAMTHLTREIEKICHFCSVDTVKRWHIDQVATRTLEAQIFELTDELAGGRAGGAFSVLDRLLQNREEPVKILGAVNAFFLRLLRVKAASSAGLTKGQIMELANTKSDWALQKARQTAGRFGYDYLHFALRECRACDERLKGSRLDNRLALEMLVGRLAEGKNNTKENYAKN